MNVYIKSNDDWTHNVKYGFVNGNETNLVNRINDSREEHPEISVFDYVFEFEKTNDYKLPYNEIDKIISIMVYNKERISEIEDIYDEPMPILYKLHPYLVQSRTKKSTEFIMKKGIHCLLQVLREIFPSLGLKLIKEYSVEDLQRINASVGESVVYEGSKQDEHIEVNPNKEQFEILSMIDVFYSNHTIGKIIWPCGMGKTILSILIVKIMNYKHILIGVPSCNLQRQFQREILKIFPNKHNIILIGGDLSYKENVQYFLREHCDEPKFVISTYHSCNSLLDLNFDFKIGDEAHHLVGNEDLNGFRCFHKIESVKSLYMTATEKVIEPKSNKGSYSMNDETIFGTLIDEKTFYWAIEHKKITDYNIVILKNSEDEIMSILNKLVVSTVNKDIFLACYMSLKSMSEYNNLTHILLYTNNVIDATLAKEYIEKLLDYNVSENIFEIDKTNFYNNALHSDNCKDLNSELLKFKKHKKGIISCVYMFGEGFDLPKINGVCIAGNMDSKIRIVQYLMRANRIDKDDLQKIAYYIIPTYNENNSFKNIKHIIYHLRNIDENIEQKITIPLWNNPNKKREKDTYLKYDFENDEEELNKLKLSLRFSRVLGSRNSEEQDEYDYVRSINTSLNIHSKMDYQSKRDIHEHYIDEPCEYFTKKGVWENWYHFYGCDLSSFIQTKEQWISVCKEKNIQSVDDYQSLCELYNLPKEPAEFYKEFTNILNELDLEVRR